MRASLAAALRLAGIAAIDLARRIDPYRPIVMFGGGWTPESPREQAARFRRYAKAN